MLIPVPTYNEPDEPVRSEAGELTPERHAWIKWFVNCKNWKCPECGCVISGRAVSCVVCRLRDGKHTPCPVGFVASEPFRYP